MTSRLTPQKDGPLQLDAKSRIIHKDGAPLEAVGTVLLCTCGQSGTKPFCDFTHESTGYTSEREIDEEIIQEYPGQEITVYFNRSICSGAGACVRGLPSVFRSGDSSNWIFPDEGAPEKIIERVKACPSGALSYRIGDGDVRQSLGDAALLTHDPDLLLLIAEFHDFTNGFDVGEHIIRGDIFQGRAFGFFLLACGFFFRQALFFLQFLFHGLLDRLDGALVDAAYRKLAINQARYPTERVRGDARRAEEYD